MTTNGKQARCVYIFILVINCIACSSLQSGWHADENIDFSQYRTFAWISENPMIRLENESVGVSPLTKKILESTIRSSLENKGYRYLDDKKSADFVLSYSIGARERVDIDSIPTAYRGEWSWYWHEHDHFIDRWHVRTWTEGTLMIDIFDNKSKEPVWHGWATKAITKKDREKPSESISVAVLRIFEDFLKASASNEITTSEY